MVSIAWILIQPRLFLPSSNSRPFWRDIKMVQHCKTTCCYRATSPNHLPRWKLPRHALHHPIRIDSGWKRCQERDTDGILHNRESYVRTSTQAAGFRRDEAQNCSLQTKFWEYIRIQCSGPIWELLRRRDWRTTKQVLTRTSFATLSQQRVLRQWW